MTSRHHNNPDFYWPVCGYTGRPTRREVFEDDRTKSGYAYFVVRSDGQRMAYRPIDTMREAAKLRDNPDPELPSSEPPARPRRKRRCRG